MAKTPPSNRPSLIPLLGDLPTPQQARSRKKRDALLAAALQAFAAHGFEHTTIEEITRGAGVAVGGFYQHFHSKQQILLVLMDAFLAELDAMTLDVSATATPMQIIHTFLGQAFRTDLRYAGAYRAWREVLLHNEQFAQLDATIQQWTTGRIAAALEQLALLPGARANVDRTTLAWVLNLLFNEMILHTPADQIEAVIETTTVMITSTLFEASPC